MHTSVHHSVHPRGPTPAIVARPFPCPPNWPSPPVVPASEDPVQVQRARLGLCYMSSPRNLTLQCGGIDLLQEMGMRSPVIYGAALHHVLRQIVGEDLPLITEYVLLLYTFSAHYGLHIFLRHCLAGVLLELSHPLGLGDEVIPLERLKVAQRSILLEEEKAVEGGDAHVSPKLCMYTPRVAPHLLYAHASCMYRQEPGSDTEKDGVLLPLRVPEDQRVSSSVNRLSILVLLVPALAEGARV